LPRRATAARGAPWRQARAASFSRFARRSLRYGLHTRAVTNS
jgi:hypothetical protein